MKYFFNPKSLVDGILPMGRNCFTCLKIGHQTKDCPIANNNGRKGQNRRVYSESHDNDANGVVCYRCRKTGHMARGCQEQSNEKRPNKQSSNNSSANNNSRDR
jgi:hypothetical protein